MKVYIVCGDTDYEGYEIIKVLSTHEAADAYIKEHKKKAQWTRDHWKYGVHTDEQYTPGFDDYHTETHEVSE